MLNKMFWDLVFRKRIMYLPNFPVVGQEESFLSGFMPIQTAQC